MGVKDIVIKIISANDAKFIIKKHHYSKKTTQNSQVHFGVFMNSMLLGAMQFGPSIDKRRMASSLGVKFNDFLELNRMAFSDLLPRNSESRAISIALRMLKKQYPFLKLIVSFADGCQCGDGTIYRASGFDLVDVKKNVSLLMDPNTGQIVAKKSLDDHITSDGRCLSTVANQLGWKPISGFMLKYVYFFDRSIRDSIKILNFSDFKNEVAMYKGKRASSNDSVASGFQSEEGGAIPTDALQKQSPAGQK